LVLRENLVEKAKTLISTIKAEQLEDSIEELIEKSKNPIEAKPFIAPNKIKARPERIDQNQTKASKFMLLYPLFSLAFIIWVIFTLIVYLPVSGVQPSFPIRLDNNILTTFILSAALSSSVAMTIGIRTLKARWQKTHRTF
jgi:uncharacterized membrane protein